MQLRRPPRFSLHGIAGRGTKGSGDEETIIRQVRAFIEAHGASRFLSMKPRTSLDGSLISERVSNRAGYKAEKGNEVVAYFVLPETFRREVCAGFDPKTVAKVLAARGYLAHDKDRWDTKATLPDFGKTRVYAIKACIMGSPVTTTTVGSTVNSANAGDNGAAGGAVANLQVQQANQPLTNGPVANAVNGAAGDARESATEPVPIGPTDISAAGDVGNGGRDHCIQAGSEGIPGGPSVPTAQSDRADSRTAEPIPTRSKDLARDLDLEL